MPICKYFLNGTCKFGDQCKFDHVDPNASSGGNGPRDPFAPSGGQGNHAKRQTGRGGKRPSATKDTPVWPLTVIGAHPLASGNTVTGDVSPEELRAQAYASAPQSRGCSDEVVRREQTIVAEFQQRSSGATGHQAHPQNTPADPFANGGGTQGMSRHQQQQQQPIFGAAQPVAQAPIFPTAAQQPMGQPNAGFAQPGGEGFGAVHLQNPLQQQPGAMDTPTGTPQASIVSTPPVAGDQFSHSPFAFQKVPETAPKPVFR